MEKKEIVKNISIFSILIVMALMLNHIDNNRYNVSNKVEAENSVQEVVNVVEVASSDTAEVKSEPIVYDNMTMAQLATQLDKSLHSDLTGTGYLFAKYSIMYNVDPYLAVAIALHETGCGTSCSEHVTKCNNVGGQRFTPTCYAGGTYGKYDTLEEGIVGFISNIGINYTAKGLTTPELMQGKYVGNTTSPWASKVNRYMSKIKSA